MTLTLTLTLTLTPRARVHPWAMVHLSHQSQGTPSQQIIGPLWPEYTHRAKIRLSHQILQHTLGSRYTLLIKYTTPKAMVHLTQQILTQLITYTYPRAMVHLTQQIFVLRHTLLSKS